jgi:hypothetical protein
MRKTTEQFIEESIRVHGDKYDYSLVDYVNNYTKVKIICSKHGIFEQQPKPHLYGQGCPKCRSFTLNDFIIKSKQKHGNTYDYSLVEYKNDKTKVKIICPKHGAFEQSPNVHYNHGCIKCFNEKQTSTLNDFIKKANIIHDNKYNYDISNYINTYKYITIMCPIHGEFNQIPYVHLRGNGCPKCKESKGESIISDFLSSNNIFYIRQKIFKDCKDKRYLPFDFFLPDYNTCIEYDGEQHFISVNFFGGEDNLKYRQKHDKIKDDFCIINDIKLLRIKYNDDINEKLNIFLF